MSEPVHCPHGWVIKNDQCMEASCLFRETQVLEEKLRQAEYERDIEKQAHRETITETQAWAAERDEAERERDAGRKAIKRIVDAFGMRSAGELIRHLEAEDE